tara:strand:+ start:183 stop:446 length:264 start_codon:yes stop_codon:yes gene_type:complete
MKITKRQLGRIIKEAVRLAEQHGDYMDEPLPPAEATPREYHAMADPDPYGYDLYDDDDDDDFGPGDSGDWDDNVHPDQRPRLARRSY